MYAFHCKLNRPATKRKKKKKNKKRKIKRKENKKKRPKENKRKGSRARPRVDAQMQLGPIGRARSEQRAAPQPRVAPRGRGLTLAKSPPWRHNESRNSSLGGGGGGGKLGLGAFYLPGSKFLLFFTARRPGSCFSNTQGRARPLLHAPRSLNTKRAGVSQAKERLTLDTFLFYFGGERVINRKKRKEGRKKETIQREQKGETRRGYEI